MSTVEERVSQGEHIELQYCPPVETHLIRSRFVAQTFRIQVMRPLLRRGEQTKFPVVYATDANRVFDLFRGISQLIQSSPLDSPRFILVGIGYPGDSPDAGAVLRARDFTTPGFPFFVPKPPLVEDVLAVEPGTKKIYGAVDFQRFIEAELIPFVDNRYQTILGDRTYFGHSGGGQFGLFSLFTAPRLFKNYILSSPSLLFDGEMDGIRYKRCEFLFDDARRFIESPGVLANTTLYMSVGAHEEFEPGLEAYQLTSSFHRMVSLLNSARIPGLKLIAEAFPAETHMTAWPMAFVHGVQAVFGTRLRSSVLFGEHPRTAVPEEA